MKTTATKLAARAAIVFAAQVALTACGDDDVDLQPIDDAGSGSETNSEPTTQTTDEPSGSTGDGDAGMSDGGGSTDPRTSGDSGSPTSGETTADTSTMPSDAGSDSGMPDGGGDTSIEVDSGADSGTEGDAGQDGGPVACYGDEQPSSIDCGVYPFDCEGPPYALDACGGMAFMSKSEVFQAVFECYEEKAVEDHCSEDSRAAIEDCQDQVMPQACVSDIPVCETLAEECTDMTAEDCEEIGASYSAMWLGLATWPETDTLCLSTEGIGNGAGCGERLANCLAGMEPAQ